MGGTAALAAGGNAERAAVVGQEQLAGAPWDAWLVQPGGGELEFRETLFGDQVARAVFCCTNVRPRSP
jgi:hypothetical protein